MKTLGQLAYEEFCRQVFDLATIPTSHLWENQDRKSQKRWEQVAKVIEFAVQVRLRPATGKPRAKRSSR